MDNSAETGQEFVKLLDTNFVLFGKNKPSREVKEIWWKLLRGFELNDIKAAFGKHAIECKFTPKPADIVDALKAIHAMKMKANREQQELSEKERQAALPAPTHNINPISELAKAKKAEGRTSEEMQELIAKHDALIAQDKRLGRIRTLPKNPNWKCAVNHCHKAGSVTGSLKGSENWYCPEHARLS